MRRFSFGKGTGTELTHHDSTSVEWIPVVRKADPQSAAVDIMHFGRFLSAILFTCKLFDEGSAIEYTRDFFQLNEFEGHAF